MGAGTDLLSALSAVLLRCWEEPWFHFSARSFSVRVGGELVTQSGQCRDRAVIGLKPTESYFVFLLICVKFWEVGRENPDIRLGDDSAQTSMVRAVETNRRLLSLD
jgi:hypothetical protein